MSNPVAHPIIAITPGDINGIGPEIILKTFADNRLLQYCTPVIYGSAGVLNHYRRALEIRTPNYNIVQEGASPRPNQLNIVNVWPEEFKPEPGAFTETSGLAAYSALAAATEACLAGRAHALVTAPIAKSSLQVEGESFPGYTEYLARACGIPMPLMLLTGAEGLRVGVATGHIPLASVAQSINKDLLHQKYLLMSDSLRRDFGIVKPRIAILALNPHAGEDGLLGSEEQEIIIPAISEMRAHGKDIISGPFPADAFFGQHVYRNYDAVLAMYHDQGLIPFKLMEMKTGVNFTAGLPIVRTSPDHGTAFDIAGTGRADETSFREALYLAIDIFRARNGYAEMTANPLRRQFRRERERYHGG